MAPARGAARLLQWLFLAASGGGCALGLVPSWPATYHMPTSTVVMPCNYSGMISKERLAGWGLVDFDWSNAKALWVNESPMDCQERLLAQAQVAKRATPNARVLVYRNLVKALPWFSDVRAKLANPAYAGWFLKYKPGGSMGPGKWHSPPCTTEHSGRTKCSAFYHDLEQTPVADSASARVQDGAWYIYHELNDVSGLSPGYRSITAGPDTATWAGCRAAAADANRTIFTWWNTSGTSGRCWFSSEWSTPPKPGTTSTLPVHEAGHVTGYRPAHGEAPPAVAVDPNTCVSGDCDCGDDIPCGEYLWDHRNQSLRTWLLDVFILGAGSALGNPAIDGFYFDDSWRSKAVPSPQPPPGSVMHSCDASPIGGATEENPFCAVDMGLTRQDVVDITSNWTLTRKMTAAALLKAKGFGWGSDSMFAGTGARAVVNDIGGATGSMDPRPKCAADLRRACAANSTWHDGALLFEFTRATFAKPFPLPYVQQDVAMFLLARGPYAWLGHNWMGCVDEALVRPEEIDVDYGTPVDERCVETRTGSGVFTRKWTTGTVMMDCNRWIGTLPAA